MPLRTIIHHGDLKDTEHFQFTDASQLRDWLDTFTEKDLATVYIHHGGLDYLTLHYETEVLSDGSEVNNIRIS